MKIAIIQDGPVYLNIEKTVEKTCEYLFSAYEQKVDLVVFGENWMTGYPIWLDICADVNLWDYEPVKQVWSRMYDNAISLESKAMAAIQKVIKELGLYVIMGANEIVVKGKGNNTIYNSIFTFGRDGHIVNHHRKLMPTYTEKLVHGLGDGYGLNTIDTDFGRLGSLICWEHWMPLTRQAMHDECEDIHIALWPYAKEMHQVASRHYAFEGRCTTVAVGQIMAVEELPKELTLSKEIRLDEDGLIMKGGAAIYAPNGDVILAPQYGNREMIVQELNLSINRGEHMNLSVSGHYQRPDVFSYHVNKKRLGVEK
jgi:nitrilase